MNKATGKAITVNGKEVTAESTFTAKAQKGTVDVTFTFDGSALEDTLIVVLETLYTEGKKVGVHADIEDDAQTVYLPKIRTNAKDAVTEIDHTETLPKAKIIDTVSYSSLLPGKEYTVTGILMNKKTGEPVLIDGKKVTAGTTFVAEKAEGSVEVVGKGIGVNRTLSAIQKKIAAFQIDENYPVYSLFSYGEENCVKLEQKMEKNGCKVDSRKQIGPAIGTHIGPEAFGVCFVEKK